MQRMALKRLITWKNQPDRMPLLLRGARQVGKTYLVEQFGETHFEQHVTINLELQPELKSCFESLTPKAIITAIEVMTGKKITPGKTLFFIDEIQAHPKAIEALRYFKEQMPEQHVIAAGSLLEFALESSLFNMPVGRIEFLFMYPLTFMEFLNAIDEKNLHDFLTQVNTKDSIPAAIHTKALTLLKLYSVLGGMPAIINSYRQHQDLQRCQELQAFILNTYRNDFGKYASQANQRHCQRLFEKAPHLIAKKFKYVDIDPDTQSRELKPAVKALKLAGIITPIFLSAATGLPLSLSINEKDFKLLFLDIGLAKYASHIDASILLNENFQLIHNGALAEQFVGQELIAAQPCFDCPELFYWRKDKRKGEAEIDYIIQNRSDIIPIEVKAGKTGRLKSLHTFIDAKQSPVGIKLSQDTLHYDKQILSLPLYMIAELNRLLDELNKLN